MDTSTKPASTIFVLDGKEIQKFGPDDDVQVEFVCPLGNVASPALHFFWANRKCVAVTRKYEVYKSDSNDLTVELKSEDIIPDHIAFDLDGPMYSNSPEVPQRM